MPLPAPTPVELFWEAVLLLLSRAVQEMQRRCWWDSPAWEEEEEEEEAAQACLCCRGDAGEGMPPVHACAVGRTLGKECHRFVPVL